jgi:hypothetical protein
MADGRISRVLPLLGAGLGIVLMLWGVVLNLQGQESAQSWSLIGIGAATLGSSGIGWRRADR